MHTVPQRWTNFMREKNCRLKTGGIVFTLDMRSAAAVERLLHVRLVVLLSLTLLLNTACCILVVYITMA